MNIISPCEYPDATPASSAITVNTVDVFFMRVSLRVKGCERSRDSLFAEIKQVLLSLCQGESAALIDTGRISVFAGLAISLSSTDLWRRGSGEEAPFSSPLSLSLSPLVRGEGTRICLVKIRARNLHAPIKTWTPKL